MQNKKGENFMLIRIRSTKVHRIGTNNRREPPQPCEALFSFCTLLLP